MNTHLLRCAFSAAVALGSIALLAACDGDSPLTDDREVYVADLTSLNTSVAGNVTGTATFTLDQGTFTANVQATGLDDILHAQHIHAANTCPTAANDGNEDGFVDLIEGAPSYGLVLVPLDGDLASQSAGQPEGFPQGTTIDYTQTVDFSTMLADLQADDPDPDDTVVKLGANESLNLEGRTVVLHGVTDSLPESVQTAGGLPSNITLPVACGTIVRTD